MMRSMFIPHFNPQDPSAMLHCAVFISLVCCTVAASTSTSKTVKKYHVVHEAVEVIRNRPEFPYRMAIRKFNKTMPVMDADFWILSPKVNSYQMWVEGFERLGMDHVYTKSAVSLAFPFCDFLAGKFIFNRGFKDFGTLPTSCPFKPGNYSLRNWIIEDKYLPPLIPGKYWRLDFYLGPVGTPIHSDGTGKFSYYCKIVYE
ncbi:unnamed protein product [Bemisia tabaci]|uniref:Uncharacterized protein n=1 Tax=Bemisia tabaci TaxID=7038 RepID=A0A9P0AFK9_BEMTA|nr:unnamed protein product [Bemisia tabaci]